MSDTDHVLAHYGVKGMKWGVRRSQKQLERSQAKRAGQSDDANRADDAATKAKKSGVGSLSNKELQDLNTRINLEQNYSKLTQSTKSDGRKFVESFVTDIAVSTVKSYAKKQLTELLTNATKK